MKTRHPNLSVEKTRHGKQVYYHRIGQGARVRIKADYDTPEFWAEYERLQTAPPPVMHDRRTLAWLIAQYQRSPHWEGLKIKRTREATYRRVLKADGDYPFADINRAHIEATVVKCMKAGQLHAANNFVQHMRHVFEWAVNNKHLKDNPCDKVKKVKLPKTDGWHKWTEDELDKYRNHWPVGTLQRLAFDIMHFTGLRASDAYRLGPKHVDINGGIEIQATKNEVVNHSLMTPQLLASINSKWTGTDTFLVTRYGRPFADSSSFRVWFLTSCREAGLPNCSAHGIRKATATAAAEAGATPHDLMGMFGWVSIDTPMVYTSKFNRKTGGQKAAKMAAERNANVVAFPMLKPVRA